ncbi:erythromycin esterase family protein [Deinococcus sp. PESE-13]
MNKPMNKIVALSLALLTPALAGGAGNPDEAAIRRSYQDLMRATVAGDSATILRFYAPKFSGYGPRYEPITREMLTARAPGLTFKSAQVTALKLVRQGQTYNVTAQVRSEGEYDLGGQKMPVVQTGETLDTWQKLGGRWQIVDSRALNAQVDLGGNRQVLADPAPLSPASRAALVAALRPLLRPVNPSGTGVADLAFLTPLAQARLIGVGEGSHGTHEHFVLKARIFKALVQEHGFTTLAFEANPARAQAVQAYISGESADLTAAVNGLGFSVWRTAEIRDLLVWMRGYNAARGSKPALNFVAVDMQDPGGSAALLGTLVPGLSAAAAPFAKLEPYQIDELVKDPAQQKAFTEQAATLLKQANALNANTPHRAQAQALARTVQQAVLAATGQGQRDDFMAENMLAYLKANPQGKVMLWAHNGHVSKAPDVLAQTGMGARLAQALGSDYRTIGQTFTDGSIRATLVGQEDKPMQPVQVARAHPDSPEALAQTAGTATLLLSDTQNVPVLRDYFALPRPVRGIGFMASPNVMGYTFEVLPRSYDVLIFTGKSTPAQPAK